MIKKLTDIVCQQQRVLLRVDFNVPMQNGQISDTTRVDAVLPSIKQLLAQNASILLVSHLGRPTPGSLSPADSLAPVATLLSQRLGQKVPLLADWLSGVQMEPGEVYLAENVRGCVGETENDPVLAQKMADLVDVVVMDAFATAHRAHASTCGIIDKAKQACIGPLLAREYEAIQHALEQPKRPLVAIVGGAKVSTKIHLLKTLITRVDTLLIGGGMANTFLMAQGIDVGDSLVETDCVPVAQDILAWAQKHHANLPLPVDVRVIEGDFDPHAEVHQKAVADIRAHDRIIDIGEGTVAQWQHVIQQAATVIWNGPVGVFEVEAFAKGTRSLADSIAQHPGATLAGGGDTLAAINRCGIGDKLSLISTGGGAFLQMLEGRPLASIEALAAHSACHKD